MLLYPLIESKNAKVFAAWDDIGGFHYVMLTNDSTRKFLTIEDADKAVDELEKKLTADDPDPFSLKSELFQPERELEG